MKLSEIETAVEGLQGVGPSTAKLFSKMGIFTVADLLSTYPRDYEDRTKKSRSVNTKPQKFIQSAKSQVTNGLVTAA